MPYFRSLLSALTFFGGHVLNRRLDRVVVVFAALAAVGIASYLVLPTLLLNASGTESLAWVMRVPAMLIVATAIASAVLTWMDARAPIETSLSMGSRVAGGIVSVFGLMVLGVSIFSLLSVRIPAVSHSSSAHSPARESHSVTRYSLYTSTHLGGHATTSELKPPPAGRHALRGRIVLDGRPVEDAEVQLLLNRTFETDTRFTDDRGEFDVPLPAGRWFINRVTVTDWDSAPEGRVLLLFSEHEPSKHSGYYSRYDLENDTGLEVRLPASNGSSIPTFELRDAINVEWPSLPSRTTHEGTAAPIADVATSAISWTSVPSAIEYEIQLSSITREDRMTSYEPILRRRQADTRLRLADLPQRPSDAPEPSEYAVTIYAFDPGGKLLTQSDDRRGELAFSLAGDVRLAQEPYPSSPPSDRIEYHQNLERLSLVSGLLDYKQLDAARAILNEVTDDAPPGRKVGMQGALEALAGNCAAALPLFDKADAEGGAGCAPPKYRHLCEAR
jgi:hypothetical protein